MIITLSKVLEIKVVQKKIIKSAPLIFFIAIFAPCI